MLDGESNNLPVATEGDAALGIELPDYNLGAVGFFLAAVVLLVFAVGSFAVYVWGFILGVIRGGGW